MTLYRQLVAWMLAVFLLLMTSVFAIEFNIMRNFLEQQQRSEVNNTINTVGLALAPYLENQDEVAVESVINALFDGSSYSAVRLIFLSNDKEIVRTYPIKNHDIPDWFTNLDLFRTIHDRRVVTSGWLQLAEVEIISHPGDAYFQLWQALTSLVTLFTGIFIIGVVVISAVVRRALKPLTLIIQKMEEVANNHFGEPLERPRTRDLIAVVDGINAMSAQVEKSFKAQAREAQQLRERAYMDPVSQLGNRSFFIGQLNTWLNESAIGGVAILQATFIKDAYDDEGYEVGDSLVKELAALLKATTSSPDVTLARINTAEFGFILPNLEESELRMVSESIMNYTQDIRPDPTGTAPAAAFLGVVYNENRKNTTEILSLVDNALSKAHAHPDKPYGLVTDKQNHVLLGKQQWRTLVEEAIGNQWVEFKLQNANTTTGATYHREVFSAIEKNGERFTANQYLFALEQLNAGHIFDQYVITSMLDKLRSRELTDTLAINLTVSSVSEPSFIRWLTKILTKNQALVNKLHFEIPESCFINHQHHTALICHAIRSAGADFGVDNYGRHFHSLEYINEFRPAYVKLDYLYTHQIDDEKQKYTLTSISRTAHNLGIKTIASRVETQAQLDFLSEHFIEAFQGFIVDK
ncbi:putative GGDEF and EAL domain-containing protein [Vibrio nigripulchritudo MADA3029]|uniref:GGDEF and EAL domain-containing protein n=2 Tax=Vibrio nigripulchritudo TaxID=28173 RepID=A0AAV2VLU7_9VIBR|nr:EAL domain-containing protein [Vibrio nigripulchritudo]EGU57497.1 Diguanylate cyclase/phosphodiesterase domain 1 (GGDEF) [Vibrio nigripulchritudo ATCC 27043]KJY79626.1 diguanylate cyclase [Vibrio nigripulchritudo]CCN36645.1 putative GGDEF and EAL domain-containing protein [Vibrio nigripulchritudo AM115]CCN43809.1 putative GGDEF and EAL domain-containing protein [Vibrio nigripulchritudo FTn2]CCN47316.1 putative GGDEF and EAL domain-containing protein [Vibrio nigripulchritudo MADA3020]